MEVRVGNGVLDNHSVDPPKEINSAQGDDEKTVDSRENMETEAAISRLRAEIRGSWEFVAACQFLVLFQENFGLESFNTRVKS